jgi:hypothetical protein
MNYKEPLLMSQTVDVTEMMNSEFQRLKKVADNSDNNNNNNEYSPINLTTTYQSIDDNLGPVYGIRNLPTELSFLRRRDREKNSVVLVFEMDSKQGFQPMRAISLRALLYEVLHEVEPTLVNPIKR